MHKKIRGFNYSEEMLPYVEAVLRDLNCRYRLSGGKIYLRMSGKDFHKVVIMAKCKKQEATYKDSPRGVLPYNKWLNPKERAKKRAEFDGRPVELLDSDKWRISDAISRGLL